MGTDVTAEKPPTSADAAVGRQTLDRLHDRLDQSEEMMGEGAMQQRYRTSTGAMGPRDCVEPIEPFVPAVMPKGDGSVSPELSPRII